MIKLSHSLSELLAFQHEHFNFQNLNDFSADTDAYIIQLSRMFLQKVCSTELPKLKKAYEEKDLNAIWFHAHKMKSNLDMFNIVRGLSLIKEIEKIARYKEDPSSMSIKVKELYEILDSVEISIREIVEKYS